MNNIVLTSQYEQHIGNVDSVRIECTETMFNTLSLKKICPSFVSTRGLETSVSHDITTTVLKKVPKLKHFQQLRAATKYYQKPEFLETERMEKQKRILNFASCIFEGWMSHLFIGSEEDIFVINALSA